MPTAAGGNRALSYTLVAVQFGCLIALALTGPWIARGAVALVIEAAGAALGAWALWTMRRARFNVVPDPPSTGTLVRTGPYHFVRHPMYTALLLIALGLVLGAPSFWRWVLWLVLVLNLLIKLAYEERMLLAAYPAYADYQAETKHQIIPYLY